jgi:hypothetical protein
MKAYRGVDVKNHVFLASVLVGGEWPASGLGRFTPGTHWTGGWVSPTAGLNDMEKRKLLTLPGLEFRSQVLQPVASRYTDCATADLLTN